MYCKNCGRAVSPGQTCVCGCVASGAGEACRCPFCGMQYQPGAVFCTNCGTRVGAAPQQTVMRMPAEAAQVLKKSGSGAVWLVALVLLTAGCLFQVLQNVISLVSLLTQSRMSASFGSLLYGLNIQGSFAQVRSAVIIGEIVAIALALLMCLGLWLFFASCRSVSSRSTAGLTIVKTCAIIYMVVFLIGCALLLLGAGVGLAEMAQYTDYYSSGDQSAAFIAVIFVALLGMVFVILFYAALLSALKSLSMTIRTGLPMQNGLGFCGVMCCIAAAFSIMALAYSDAIGIIGNLLSAAALIVSAVALFAYKGRLSRLMAPAVWPTSQAWQSPNVGYGAGVQQGWNQSAPHSWTPVAPIQQPCTPVEQTGNVKTENTAPFSAPSSMQQPTVVAPAVPPKESSAEMQPQQAQSMPDPVPERENAWQEAFSSAVDPSWEKPVVASVPENEDTTERPDASAGNSSVPLQSAPTPAAQAETSDETEIWARPQPEQQKQPAVWAEKTHPEETRHDEPAAWSTPSRPVCAGCGKELEDTDIYCTHCGRKR